MRHRPGATATEKWDAGEAGCGQLIVGLNRKLAQLKAGETLEVTAHDAGAAIDIFVWCRMTGHVLLSEAHPVYVIQRNDR